MSSINLFKTSRCVWKIGSYFNDHLRIKDISTIVYHALNNRRLKTITANLKNSNFCLFYINGFVILKRV